MASKHRSKREDEPLRWRAVAAFVKYAKPSDLLVPMDQVKTTVVEIDGLLYVTLTAGKRLLSCYRVRNDGLLKKLRRLPRELQPDE